MIEKLNYQDKRLIFICVIISVVSFFITQNYYREAFPYASIDMDYTQDDAKILAEKLLINKGYDIQDFKQASRFGHLDREKLFFEYHLSREEAGEILNETNSYFWQNRWFIPEQKEEFKVNISTTGKLAEYEHKIDEDAPGDTLSKENALQVAQLFLSGAVDSWDMENWKLESTKIQKQKNRIDHQFEWVEKSFDKNGSTHRISIRVQGSVVDYYKEWIKVPDTWERDYTKMGSKGEILAIVGFSFIVIIISYLFISILIRARKKDLRWKTAFIYSGIIAFLYLINNINNLPLEFYSLDTKDTLVSFWAGFFLLDVLFGPVVMFFFIGMLIAAAEPFYREQFPQQISFGHILTAQGIKSRSFFNSAVIGISLTFAFFAFGTIFRIMENKMGGFTATEVPKFDMLSTYIPFVGVLLAGLSRTIRIETLFRMFFIPFLQKYTKSSLFAVVISSIIWGLTHASHGIHQPFYMHFIEMSIWGCIIGWIFLQYGILATLIWHFSIKAVPSAMILLQSSNPYYITTGFVSAGLILIPLIYAIISYRRNGGFVLSNNLVNILDTEIFEEKTEVKEEIKKVAISTTYKPLSRNRVRAGLIIGFIGIFSFIAVTINDPLSNLKKLDKSSAEASKIAKDYLLMRGFDLKNYRPAYDIEDVFYDTKYKIEAGNFVLNLMYPQNEFFEYIKETSGKDALRSYLSKPDIRINDWVIRYFKSETKREYKVWVNAKGQDNGVIYFEETLADTTYIPSLSKENAQVLVNQFAQQHSIDLINMDLVDNSKIDKGSRIDHFFKYKAKNHKNNIVEAEKYFEFEVYGNHIGKFKTGMELPEVWLREFNKGEFYNIIYFVIFLFSFITLFILAIRYLLKLLKDNKPNWKWALIISALAFSIQIIITIDHLPHLLFQQYNTSQALNLFLFQTIMFSAVMMNAFMYMFFLAPILLVNLGWPSFYNTFLKNNRGPYLKDAFVCLFCSVGLYYFYTLIKHLLLIYHATYFPYDMGIPYIGEFWFLTLFFDEVISNTIFYYFSIIGIFYVFRQLTTKGWGRKLFFIIVFSLPFIMPFNNPEPILFILNIIWFGFFIVLFRYFMRGNTWGYLFGIMGFFIIPHIIAHFQTIQVSDYRYHLIAAILCIGLFFLYFLKEAFFKPQMIDK